MHVYLHIENSPLQYTESLSTDLLLQAKYLAKIDTFL